MPRRPKNSNIPSQTTVPHQGQFHRDGEEIDTNAKPTSWTPAGAFPMPKPGALEGDYSEFIHESHTNGKEK